MMTNRARWFAVTVVLLVAAVLRLWGLGDVPPGLSHDEVANWLIARDILDGNHAIYFTAAYGHEPLYQYAQAGTVALFGDHWLGLRWPSVAFSLLGIAATYTLIRRLLDESVALLAAGWLAVSFWPLFYARVAYRAVLLPLTAVLSAYFLIRAACRPSESRAGLRTSLPVDVSLAGLFLGLSIYTYPAARVLPLVLAAAFVYAKIVHPHPGMPWSRILPVFVIGALVAAPLMLWLEAHPTAEYRIAELSEPMDRLLAGDPSLAWENLIANLKFFVMAGDPWPRYNIPGRPVFADPVSGVLFFGGLAVTLWNWRNPRYGVLLIWLMGSLAPSIVTSDAPSSIRDILGMVVVFAFPGIALVEMWQLARARFPSLGSWAPPRSSIGFYLVGLLALAPCLLLTRRDYFVRWPQNEVVRFDYQADLTAVGEFLEELDDQTGIAVSGLSVHTMDKASLELASRADVADVRLCDTRETLVVPSSASGDSRLLIPQVVPLDEDLRSLLIRWGATESREPSFTSYSLGGHAPLAEDLAGLQTAASLPDGTDVTGPVSFGGRLAFLGCERMGSADQDDVLTLLTHWRVEEPPPTQLKIFAHAVNAVGDVVGQDDGLASPSDTWHRDDILVQKHVIDLPSGSLPDGAPVVRIGVYEASSQNRLRVFNADHLQIALERGTE